MPQILLGGFEIDANISEEHSLDAEVTEYPVETGADIADHVRSRPIVITLDCLVSETPLGSLIVRRERDFGGSTRDKPTITNAAFTYLQFLRDKREPISVVTSLRSYSNMLIRSISIPRDGSTGDALSFRVVLSQLQLVTNTRTVTLVAIPRAQAKRNLGSRPTKPVPSATPPVATTAVVQTSPRVTPAVNVRKPATRAVNNSPAGKIDPFYSIGGGTGKSRF